MKNVGLISLGCSKNLVDSENILGLLSRNLWNIVSEVEDADVVIINTCGFIESSKKESIDTILEVCSSGKKVVVTGCLVERYYHELVKEIPEVDLFIPIRHYFKFNELLASIFDDIEDKSLGIDEKYRAVSTGDFSAYLKIGEGCSNRCSYCAIPLIRGDFYSRRPESILEEADRLAKAGYKEIVVLQQDTTKYGIDLEDKNVNIVYLLKELLKVKSFEYIRLLYLYPDEVTDELIELIASEPRLTPYFDIPIQHSEDRILSLMNRRGDKNLLINLFKKIREKCPKAILRTTVMVGFPGETEEEFENLVQFIKDIEFDHLGCFGYSREDDTPAFNFPDQIDEEVKKQRVDKIMKTQQNISYRKNKSHIGEIMEGLVVGTDHDYYCLRSYWNAPDDVDGKILFKSDKKLSLGDKVKVQIKSAFVYDLLGEIVL
ncbi:MAG: 30S ribosomal protein S12 methylthiotransferase RimO [Bacilli bacterium]|nr:30S ribosomal protein S12 methylthiotransferase RimO [Bacilli bacterium]